MNYLSMRFELGFLFQLLPKFILVAVKALFKHLFQHLLDVIMFLILFGVLNLDLAPERP